MKELGLEEDRRKIDRADIFKQVERVEFDTLLFFFGVLNCCGALQYIGFLKIVGGGFYDFTGFTTANTSIGIFSAIVDNIPLCLLS